MQLERDQSPRDRAFAIRHGLGHVLGGHVADFGYSAAADDWDCHEEAVADLFALADLLPDREMNADPEWLAGEISLLAPDWPHDRVFDRTALRLALWRAP